MAGNVTQTAIAAATSAAAQSSAPAADRVPNQPGSLVAGQRTRDKLNINSVWPRSPDWVSTGSVSVDQALRNPQLTLYKIRNTAYKFSFMLIPISLPFLWLMFCGRPGVVVYDHMVFAMYSLSFMSLWFTLIALMNAHPATADWIGAACMLPPIHMFLHLRETYSLGKWATLWRTAALLAVAGTVFVAFTLAVVIISVR